MTIQCDHVIEAKRPDIVVLEKENKKAIIVDIASPWATKCIGTTLQLEVNN